MAVCIIMMQKPGQYPHFEKKSVANCKAYFFIFTKLTVLGLELQKFRKMYLRRSACRRLM
jgi:hypothetical protein